MSGVGGYEWAGRSHFLVRICIFVYTGRWIRIHFRVAYVYLCVSARARARVCVCVRTRVCAGVCDLAMDAKFLSMACLGVLDFLVSRCACRSIAISSSLIHLVIKLYDWHQARTGQIGGARA